MRDLQFITPVKAKIGPPQAMCHQTQRFQVGHGVRVQPSWQRVAARACLHECAPCSRWPVLGSTGVEARICRLQGWSWVVQNTPPCQLKGAASSGHVHLSQVFSGRHLVLETSQVMSEIPYSDHFRWVAGRCWDRLICGAATHAFASECSG